MTPMQAVEALRHERADRMPLRTTGFAALDAATGGFEPGHVWIVTGTPGQGRSTLATQWALLLGGRHGLHTQLISKRDPVGMTGARLAASAGKVPILRLWHQDLQEHDHVGMERGRAVLQSTHLEIAGPNDLSMLDVDLGDATDPEALIVDDAGLAAGVFPDRVATWAARGILVILTLPQHEVLSTHGVEPAWSRVTDFVLDIDRPDLVDHESLRPGEADLHLVRNRYGPTRLTTVAHQGHYCRFIDMAH